MEVLGGTIEEVLEVISGEFARIPEDGILEEVPGRIPLEVPRGAPEEVFEEVVTGGITE